MSLYYIHGVSGAGKSTVLKALESLGYESYDIDVAGPVTAKWKHISTGYVHPKSSVKAEMRTPKFLAEHMWYVSPTDVSSLAQKAVGQVVFFGGSCDNEAEFIPYCSGSFAITIDDGTMLRRLADRSNNDWGKSTHERVQAIEKNQKASQHAKQLGSVLVEGTLQAEEVVQTILEQIHEH